uniref:uncharacterized protein LOC117611449 n=1 Tax=Osmia lignaria TaxID=473952 RepID=UPI00147917F1|nr:uncharacterized protein LOC117611449 [Osmia lignaria]
MDSVNEGLAVVSWTNMREPLSSKLKLEITLRYLCSGDSFNSLMYLFRVPSTTISHFIPEVCDALTTVLKEYLQVPSTFEKWERIQRGFEHRWNFPNVIGALDGKHVNIILPISSGSDYYNYKGKYSIVLTALVDDDYRFTYIDVGAKGRFSDGGIFRNSSFYTALTENSLNIPDNGIIVADDAFPLTSRIMKPYKKRDLSISEKVFNYRLIVSRARRNVENAFGILTARFRIFENDIKLQPEKVEKIIFAACSLHNWLRTCRDENYWPREIMDREDTEFGQIISGHWRQITRGLTSVHADRFAHNPARHTINIRNEYCEYFNGVGAVP